MAAKPTLPTALYQLEQQLTCAVCLDIYTNPKTLPCLHSFCLQCLEGLPVIQHFIKCPTCRTSTELPEPTGPAGFPIAFHLNNLKETYDLMKNIQTIDEDLTASKTSNSDEESDDCNDYFDLTFSTPTTESDSDKSQQALQSNLNPSVSEKQEPKCLSDIKWFHGNISRSDTETLLQPLVDGAFLVRNSQTNKDDFTLSLSFKGQVAHYKITKDARGYVSLGGRACFENLVNLVKYYQQDANGLCCKLMHGIGKDFPGPYDNFASMEDLELFRDFFTLR